MGALQAMAIDGVVASLLRLPIFAGLKPLQITEVARQAERRAFHPGDLITEEGAPGEAAYLILSGEAARRPKPGSDETAEPIEPGSLVGELAMLVDHIYGATVVADSRVDCLEITRAALHAQMRDDPDVAERLAHVVRDRLTRLAHELRCIDQLLLECAPAIPGRPPLPVMVPDLRGVAAK